jgi:hypothetical protein
MNGELSPERIEAARRHIQIECDIGTGVGKTLRALLAHYERLDRWVARVRARPAQTPFSKSPLREAAEREGLDVEKMERAADLIVAACTELGLSRREVASVTSAIFCNHAVATGVTEERAVASVVAMYRWRSQPPESVLVDDGAEGGAK